MQILRLGYLHACPGRSFLSPGDNEISSSTISSDSRRSSMSGVAWPRPGATETLPPRPFSLHEGDRPDWPLPDTSSRTNAPTHELMRASSLRGRRRRTLLPESAFRRDSNGFLHSMNNALNQVESGLLHMNRELNALADEEGDHMRRYVPQNESEPMRPHSPARSGPHMDWTFESTQRNPTPPPTLPPFEFVSAQRNSGWPAERYNHHSGETSGLGLDLQVEYPARRTPTRGSEGYFEQRQSMRDSSSTRGTRASSYAHEGSWRSSGPSNEWWSNDTSSPNLPTHMPLRDRLLFRPSGSGHQSVAVSRQPEPVNNRSNNMGSSMQAQPPSATFGRLHRRRLSPPAPPHQPSVSSSLLRPFANQNSSSSPTRSYASRFSHFLPRRNSGRGGGGSSDDNDEWHHAEQATRRFFLRPRGRARPSQSNGDYMRDDEFDDSYEGLLRLAARIGEAKPRGTPSEVIRSMLSCRYADSPGARAEARCPICLDDYAPDDIVTVVKRCSHWFHRECVQVSSMFLVCIRTRADSQMCMVAMAKVYSHALLVSTLILTVLRLTVILELALFAEARLMAKTRNHRPDPALVLLIIPGCRIRLVILLYFRMLFCALECSSVINTLCTYRFCPMRSLCTMRFCEPRTFGLNTYKRRAYSVVNIN
ncbi:hypothetical protein B0J17DRAFT_414832 [Rhizoctonia solani]|nr:hypothetical protein B0J17DRAFT_414832 [Rhizoctonia solani]